MAHFAKISEENIVLQVLTLDNKDMLNGDNVETESVGQAHLQQHNNWPARLWIQTSYNTKANTHSSGNNSKAFRGNYAGIGMTYDEDNDIFIYPKPFPSWVLNVAEARWQSPLGDEPTLTEQETLKYGYLWNETDQSWDKIDLQPTLVL